MCRRTRCIHSFWKLIQEFKGLSERHLKCSEMKNSVTLLNLVYCSIVAYDALPLHTPISLTPLYKGGKWSTKNKCFITPTKLIVMKLLGKLVSNGKDQSVESVHQLPCRTSEVQICLGAGPSSCGGQTLKRNLYRASTKKQMYLNFRHI